MCKSIKNWESKILTKPILSSIYTEESKKIKKNDKKRFEQFQMYHKGKIEACISLKLMQFNLVFCKCKNVIFN